MLGLSALKEALAKHFYDDNIDLAEILDELRQCPDPMSICDLLAKAERELD